MALKKKCFLTKKKNLESGACLYFFLRFAINSILTDIGWAEVLTIGLTLTLYLSHWFDYAMRFAPPPPQPLLSFAYINISISAPHNSHRQYVTYHSIHFVWSHTYEDTPTYTHIEGQASEGQLLGFAPWCGHSLSDFGEAF